jgi:hypothetical protein
VGGFRGIGQDKLSTKLNGRKVGKHEVEKERDGSTERLRHRREFRPVNMDAIFIPRCGLSHERFTDRLNRYLVKLYNDLPVWSGRNFAGPVLLVR